jgi:hypothetical protein
MGMTGVITGLPLFLLKPVKSLSPAVKTGHDPVGPSSSWAKVQVAALEGAAPRVVMPRRPKALSPRTIERLAGSMEVVQACPESIGVYSLNCATARRPVVKLSGSWLRVGAAKLSHGKASAHLLHRIVSRKSDAGRSAPGAVRSGCGSRCGQGRQGLRSPRFATGAHSPEPRREAERSTGSQFRLPGGCSGTLSRPGRCVP